MEVKTASIGVGKFPMLDTVENFVQVLFDNDFPMKVPFVIPRVNKHRVSNPKPQGGNGSCSYMTRYTCAQVSSHNRWLIWMW